MGWMVKATSRPIYSPRKKCGTHCRGWVDPRADLDGRGNLAHTGNQSPDRPARNRYTEWANWAHAHDGSRSKSHYCEWIIVKKKKKPSSPFQSHRYVLTTVQQNKTQSQFRYFLFTSPESSTRRNERRVYIKTQWLWSTPTKQVHIRAANYCNSGPQTFWSFH